MNTLKVKRTKIKSKEAKKIDINKNEKNEFTEGVILTVVDVTCPICLSIMIKPVTMPCSHSLCMVCFELNVSESNLSCPLCRKRISIWVRKTRKTKKFLDEELWHKIQIHFKEEVENKMNGNDLNNTFTLTHPPVKVSTPGEIQKEYKAQLRKLREDEETRRQKEAAASKAAILALQEEESKQLSNIQLEKESILEKDFEFAKQLRTSQIKETLYNFKTMKKSPQHQQKIQNTVVNSPPVGPMDLYLGQVTPSNSRKNSFQTHSTPLGQVTPSNSRINSFQTHSTPLAGTSKSVANLACGNLERKFSEEIRVPSADSLSVFSPCPSSPSRVFKDITAQYSSESETEFDSEENIRKTDKQDKRVSKRNDSENCELYDEAEHSSSKNSLVLESEKSKVLSNCQLNASTDDESQWQLLSEALENNMTDKVKFMKLLEEQKAAEKMLQQEEGDRRYALQLQKSMREVDRTKGSKGEYCLRNQAAGSSSKGHSPTNSKCKSSRSSKCKSSRSPASSSNNSNDKLRQQTLLESLAKRQRRV